MAGDIVDEMVGQHHRLNGHEFEQTLQEPGGLQSMGSQRVRQDRTERLNNKQQNESIPSLNSRRWKARNAGKVT